MNNKLLRKGEPRASTTGVLRALTLPARLGGLLMLLLNQCFAGPVSSFEDILYWTGSGNNRSALVLDWQGDSTADHALVWGYRWDGTRKGSNLLLDIVAADPRLYAKVVGQPSYMFVLGLGYDTNNDGVFALNDGTSFDSNGIAWLSSYEDGAEAEEPDLYAEGYGDTIGTRAFWQYGVAAESPFADGAWMSSPTGISLRPLANGSWDSLAYVPLGPEGFGQNPLAALPAGDADFDADGQVEGGDFLQWQRGFGISTGATLADGDADGDGDVDAADLGYWQTNYGTVSGSLITAYAAVPEPSGVLLIWISSWLYCLRLATLKKGSVS